MIDIPDFPELTFREERKFLFSKAQELYGKEDGNNKIKELLAEVGVESTTDLKKSQYDAILSKLEEGKSGDGGNEDAVDQ